MPLNHRDPIFDAKIWFEFDSEEDFEVIRVEAIAHNRLKILESTSAMSGYRLLFGDEIEVESMGVADYKLKAVTTPSAYVHFFSIWGGLGHPPISKQTRTLGEFLDESGFTAVLHDLNGEWECEMGGLLTVHCPRSNLSLLEERTGWSFSGESQEVSGPMVWGPS